jgi:hypothetical protein
MKAIEIADTEEIEKFTAIIKYYIKQNENWFNY